MVMWLSIACAEVADPYLLLGSASAGDARRRHRARCRKGSSYRLFCDDLHGGFIG